MTDRCGSFDFPSAYKRKAFRIIRPEASPITKLQVEMRGRRRRQLRYTFELRLGCRRLRIFDYVHLRHSRRNHEDITRHAILGFFAIRLSSVQNYVILLQGS